jgi:hypothetical protein
MALPNPASNPSHIKEARLMYKESGQETVMLVYYLLETDLPPLSTWKMGPFYNSWGGFSLGSAPMNLAYTSPLLFVKTPIPMEL